MTSVSGECKTVDYRVLCYLMLMMCARLLCRTTNSSLRIVPPPPDTNYEPEVQLVFTGGSTCHASASFNSNASPESSSPVISASTIMTFICDLNNEGEAGPRLLAQMPPGDDSEACVFVFEWHTQVGPETVFVGLLVVALILSLSLSYPRRSLPSTVCAIQKC